MRRDLILSSGFLAFGGHVGFLGAVEEAGVEVGAVCGTSSGALAGALWAAGLPAADIGRELGARPPRVWLRPSVTPWRGLFRSGVLVERLAQLLPPEFDDLPRPLAVGVRLAGGGHRLIRSGSLPHAVAASCAIPFLFQGVTVDGLLCHDGGAVDRLGLSAWRRWRPGESALVHRVARSRGRDVEARLDGCLVVDTPASGATFWSLGDFEQQIEWARSLTLRRLGD